MQSRPSDILPWRTKATDSILLKSATIGYDGSKWRFARDLSEMHGKLHGLPKKVLIFPVIIAFRQFSTQLFVVWKRCFCPERATHLSPGQGGAFSIWGRLFFNWGWLLSLVFRDFRRFFLKGNAGIRLSFESKIPFSSLVAFDAKTLLPSRLEL